MFSKFPQSETMGMKTKLQTTLRNSVIYAAYLLSKQSQEIIFQNTYWDKSKLKKKISELSYTYERNRLYKTNMRNSENPAEENYNQAIIQLFYDS